MSNPIYLLTDFSCCEDFENYLKFQNHANRELLDSLTTQLVGEWNKKACNLAVMGSNICLLDKDGMTLATVPLVLQDGETITRDPVTGKVTCVRLKVNGLNKAVWFWLGTKEQYKNLTTKNPNDTVYFFTDINLSELYDEIESLKLWASKVENGTFIVSKSAYAYNSGNAENAQKSNNAVNAEYAKSAGKAETADYASRAGSAVSSTNATNATTATTLKNGDLVFGRSLLWRPNSIVYPNGRNLPASGDEITIDLAGIIDKFIVVEIRIETGATYDSQTAYKVRTPAFNCKSAEKQSLVWRYSYDVGDGVKVEFRCYGDNKLCVRQNGSTGETASKAYILAIYEEL